MEAAKEATAEIAAEDAAETAEEAAAETLRGVAEAYAIRGGRVRESLVSCT